MSESWVEKHRPDTWSDVQGNNKSLEKIKKWATNWSPGDKPQLLVGPPGTGKTTTGYIASDEMGYPLNKVNLSLKRRTEELSAVARSMHSSSADGQYQLVLLDECDNMHGSPDKKPLYAALREPRNPIILTANEKYEVPDSIKRACDVHDFKLGKRSRKAKIKEIADRESVDLSPSELKRLVERPDLRSAINDLQTAAESDTPVGEDQRTWSEGEFPAVQALLGGENRVWKDAVGYEDNTFDRIDSAILWADENLSEEFRGLEAGVAYQLLAYADLWAGRAWNNGDSGDFREMKYGYAMIESIPDSRLSEPYGGYIDVSFPKWFRTSTVKHDGQKSEAKLYRGLKGGDRSFQFSGSFYNFRQNLLPILRNLPEEDRLDLVLNHGLGADAMEALDLDPDDYEEWREMESPQEGEGWSPDTDSAADASW